MKQYRGLLVALAFASPTFAWQASSGTDAETEPKTIRGEKLSADEIMKGQVVDMMEFAEFAKSLPTRNDGKIRRARNGANGEWALPTRSSAEEHHSGIHYIINGWGDTRIGMGFGQSVEFDGVWIKGQADQSVWASAVRVIGYRDGREVAATDWFEEIGAEPVWFDIGLAGIDRAVFEARAKHNGSGWYALDDLQFTAEDGTETVLTFETLPFKTKLASTEYGGISWERGTGDFTQGEKIVPAPKGDETASETTVSESTGTHALGGGGTSPSLVTGFEGAQERRPGRGLRAAGHLRCGRHQPLRRGREHEPVGVREEHRNACPSTWT